MSLMYTKFFIEDTFQRQLCKKNVATILKLEILDIFNYWYVCKF